MYKNMLTAGFIGVIFLANRDKLGTTFSEIRPASFESALFIGFGKAEKIKTEGVGFEPTVGLSIFPGKNTVFSQRDSQWGRNPTQIFLIGKALNEFGDAILALGGRNLEPAIQDSIIAFLIQLIRGEEQPKLLAVDNDEPLR